METIFTLGLMTFLGLMFILTLGLSTDTIAGDALGARGFPLALIVAGFVLCLVILLRRAGENKATDGKLLDLGTPEGKAVLASGIVLLAYLALMNVLGYILATMLFSLVAARAMGFRKPGLLVLFSALLTTALFLLFGKLFMVPLPRGIGPLRELSYLLY